MSGFSGLINSINEQISSHRDFFYSITEGYRKILFKKTPKSGPLWVGVKDYPCGRDVFRRVKMKEVEAHGVNVESLPEYSGFHSRFNHLKWNCGFKHASVFASKARKKSRTELDRARDEKLSILYDKRKGIYEAYLSSGDWFQKRNDCFFIHGFMCVDCKKSAAVDVHHRHYESLGDECAVRDLVPLCRPCHKYRHEKNSLMDKPE